MQLKIANINSIVEIDKLKQIKTSRVFQRNIQSDSLFSEEIFGKFGSEERKKTFAYIDLKVKIIHPEVFENILTSIDTDITRFITYKQRYIIDPKGNLIPSTEPHSLSGVHHFIENFDNINIDKFSKSKSQEINFLKKYRKRIFIDKCLVLPAGIRDIQFSEKTNKSFVQYAQLNELYESLLRLTNASSIIDIDEGSKETFIQNVQKSVIEVNKWIKERLHGKSGLVRGGLMRKVIDFSGRLVIATDNKLKLGEIGLPWQVVLRLYEPFALHEIQKDSLYLSLIQDYLKSDSPIDTYQLKYLLKKLNNQPDIVPPLLQDYFFEIAKKIAYDKTIIYKRDPVEDRNSYCAADIRVDKIGHVMKINPLELQRNGADHDGDCMAVYPLFTKEANQEAREKMHPKYSRSVWKNSTTNVGIGYGGALHDAASTLYTITLQ